MLLFSAVLHLRVRTAEDASLYHHVYLQPKISVETNLHQWRRLPGVNCGGWNESAYPVLPGSSSLSEGNKYLSESNLDLPEDICQMYKAFSQFEAGFTEGYLERTGTKNTGIWNLYYKLPTKTISWVISPFHVPGCDRRTTVAVLANKKHARVRDQLITFECFNTKTTLHKVLIIIINHSTEICISFMITTPTEMVTVNA